MTRPLVLGVLGLLLLCALISAKPSRDRNRKNFRLVCYLGTWAYYRHGAGKHTVEDIDPYLCTHLVYGFTKIENDRIAVFDPYLDLKENWGLGNYERFNNLRRKNPELSTIVAIGGWNEGSRKYSDMARDPRRRQIFVQSVVEFLKKYDFDGLDFDWEYPAGREGSRPEDKENFVLCLKELKEAFAPHGYLLTAAVSAGKTTIDSGYDIPKISQYLDFVNLMTYDFHGGWDSFTGHNSPLFARPDESPDQQILNANFSVNYWLSHGTPRDKLVMGMALYGRCLRLSNPDDNGLGAPIQGAGNPGPFTNEPGMIGFNELCDTQGRDSSQWTIVREEHTKAPYAYKDHQWCSYDDRESIQAKVDYLKSMNLSGGMVWSLETDDFRGHCFGTPYPLLSTIYNGLSNRNPVTQPPTRKPTPTIVPQNGTTTVDPLSTWCTEEGIFGFVGECQKFYECQKHSNQFRFIPRICPPGTSFNHDLRHCVQSHLVSGCGNVTQNTTTTHAPVNITNSTVFTRTNPTPTIPVNITNPVANTTGAPVTNTTRTPVTNAAGAPVTNTTRTPVTNATGAPVTNTTRTPVTNVTREVVVTTEKILIANTTKVSVGTTTTPPKCTVIGTFPHPTDCSKFIQCQETDSGFIVNVQECPPGLVFNPGNLNCDFLRNVKECQKK